MAAPARRPARSCEIPQSYFDFHKFGVVTGEAPELSQFDFLSPMPGGKTGFWMKTRNSKIFFELTKTEEDDGRVYRWAFSSVGWTPLKKQVHISIYNSGPIMTRQRLIGSTAAND